MRRTDDQIDTERDQIEEDAFRECDQFFDRLMSRRGDLRNDPDVEAYYRARGRSERLSSRLYGR